MKTNIKENFNEIIEFKTKLFQRAAEEGFQDYEIYFTKGTAFELRIFQREIAQYKNANHVGLCFRATINGKMGYSYTERIDLDVIDFLLAHAKSNAVLIEAKEPEKLFSGSENYVELDNYNDRLTETSVEEKINLAKKLEELTYLQDKRIVSVDSSVLATGEMYVYISNSIGLSLFDRTNYAMAYVVARAVEHEQTKMGSELWFGNDFKDFDPEKISSRAVEKAISSLGASSVASKNYPVLIENSAVCDLLSAFENIFYAERVQKGFSLLKDKLNGKIASDKITIRDDGILEGGLLNRAFDSEGVATTNKAVIENGVLKTYLYNLKSAEKDRVQSTGNGFKSSFKSSIDTSCTNFYIVPSEETQNDLMNKMADGIMITELSGLHSGTNSISGDFSLLASGFLIEAGKKTRAVEQITVAGNFYELLKNVTAVGCDLKFDYPSSIGSPSILIDDMSISGI